MQDLTPVLEPVKAFHDADELEAQFKALSADVFKQYLRFVEREINAYGMPHLASFEQVERWVKADGLAMVRGSQEDPMRYLFKAWRGQNPKRGLHFLRTYLQLLWPGGWDAEQQWQRKNATYPTALSSGPELAIQKITNPRLTHFLTSRLNVDITAQGESGDGLAQVARSLRYICGAKFLVNLRVLRRGKTDLRRASIFSGTQMLMTHGELQPLDGLGTTGTKRAGIFSGTNTLVTVGTLQ